MISKVFTVQKKIGRVAAIIGLIIAAINVTSLSVIPAYNQTLLSALIHPAVLYVFILSVISYLLTLKVCNKSVFRVIQISIILIVGIASTLALYCSAAGLCLIALATILLYQYNFLEKRTYLKLAIISVATFSLVLYSAQAIAVNAFISTTNIFLFMSMFSYSLWVVFNEDIKAYVKRLKQKEQAALIGENVNLIIHDFNNIVHQISAGIELLELEIKSTQADKDITEQLDLVKSASIIIKERLTDLLTSRRLEHKEEAFEELDIVKLVNSVLHLTTNLNEKTKQIKEVKSVIPNEEIKVYTIGRYVKRIIENLLKNALEAAIQNNKDNSYVKASLTKQNSNVVIEISDSGGGLKCMANYKVGQYVNITNLNDINTTKENGSGLGIKSTLNLIQKLRGSILYYKTLDGVQVRVTIPTDRRKKGR